MLFLEGETLLTRTIPILNAQLGTGVSKTLSLDIAVPPSHRYVRGVPSLANITITGVGPIGQDGILQFSAPSVSVPENGGPVSLMVNRTGTVAPGPAQVRVTSADGTAVAPTHYAAVDQTLNWAGGDSASKPVSFTPVNVATQQGDRTCGLSMSNATGAVIGTTSSAEVSILDMTVPVAGPGAYPLGRAYTSGIRMTTRPAPSWTRLRPRTSLSSGCLPSRGMAYYQSACAAIKARNQNCKPILYWDPYFIRTNASGQNPFTSSLINYFRSQPGVPGLGVGANEWLAQRADGVQVTRALYGTTYYPNFHPNVQTDSQGRRAFAYHLEWLKLNVLDAVPAAEGLYLDDLIHRDHDWAGSWVYQTDNLNVSTNDAAKRVSLRNGLKLGIDHFRSLTSTQILMGNCGGWVLETANVVPVFSSYQLDGITFEQRFGTNISTFGLRPSGNSIINNGVGNFATGMSKVNHALYATQNFRIRTLRSTCSLSRGMPAANRNGAGKAAGYRYFRYAFGCSQIWHRYLFPRPRSGRRGREELRGRCQCHGRLR